MGQTTYGADNIWGRQYMGLKGGEDAYMMPYLFLRGHFPRKNFVISGSFAERDLLLIRYPMHLCHTVS